MCTRKLGCGRRHTQDENAQSLKQERATCCSWSNGCKCSKSEEREVKGKPEEERASPTGTILAYAEHDKSKEVSNVAVVFKHVLIVAETAKRMEQRMRDARERVEERLIIIAPH